ncbi:MAG TPA: hypothetical protein VMV47_00280 [Bacteroidales bacterium]|nr:hypothetical protein [Bacteroidales bacterium]
MNKVLIITYYWPPSGGAGVQRWLKFAKFLPEHGWEPVILTVDPEYAAYPAIDNSLAEELPVDIPVHRTPATDWFRIYSPDKSKIPSAGFASNPQDSFKGRVSRFIRGNFFIPDPRRGWNRFAFRKACEIIEKEKIVTFVTTSPPHSTQLIGIRLKKKYPDIKWIADIRDPWTDIYYYDQFYPTWISKKIDSGYERQVLGKADRIISVGFMLKELLAGKLPESLPKIEVITNGFDESDFNDIRRDEPSRFTITYVGTLSEKYPITGFLNALRELKKKSDFVLRIVGTIPENIKEQVTGSVRSESLEFIPYTKHRQAISYMINSSLLLLIIPEAGDNRLIITGKIYEYIASGNQVLCLGPVDGDAAQIISKLGIGTTLDYSDQDKIEKYISEIISNPVKLNIDPSEFSRRNLTKKLASVL